MQIYDANPKIKENTLKGILFVSSKFNKRAFESIIRFVQQETSSIFMCINKVM